ncbi:hypothetical protein KC675_00385 [Candidatus Dojkabacteria bacterium]|uniref:Lycopene cyclase domain-containing protein n=1 Tax=Candidatus Dojkabacteria bacterium TaxID=2099670 RepID=A0A955I835_9BACT|nr:hypothetical protein [Candidatus Dojkabacteria bacterium]
MYSYFFAVFLAFLVWLFLFIIAPQKRKEMVIVGAILTPFVIFDILTVPNYWEPVTLFGIPVGIEGVFFTFLITGIASVIYEVTLRKRYRFNKLNPHSLIIFLVPGLISLLAVYVLKLNIIYLFILAFAFMTLTILSRRKDLAINSIYSSLLFGFIYVSVFNIWIFISPESINWWNKSNLTPVSIGFLPFEEFLFSITLGSFAGPLYEYLSSAVIVKK